MSREFCRENERFVEKMDGMQQGTKGDTYRDIRCINEHPGFTTVCLDEYVLETAYYHYRQEHGALSRQARSHRCVFDTQ